MPDPHYFGNAIWTNHALERLEQRKLPQDLAWKAFQYPDKTIPGKQTGSTEYQKYVGNSLVTVIAKKNEEGEWIILSCWVDPPLPGTIDYIKKQDYVSSRKQENKSYWR